MLPDAFEGIINFAIEREEEAYKFYMDLSEKVNVPAMKAVFKEFAHEEQGHKAKLQGMKSGKVGISVDRSIKDLKLSDYTVDVDPEADIDYQHALILAMKKEKAAFKLYTDLATSVSDENLRSVFKMLAQEEAKHKLRFEIEYDENILSEN
jgi:rubrerythrin